MKIALLGYGRMGKLIEKLAIEKGHTISSKINQDSSKEELLKADIAIEFSTPEAAVSNIKFCLENSIPIVSGTTGWLAHYDEMIKLCENRNGSFIYASNFSIGVNL
ncbi:MAG: 4-hydroxy-tetrahydrodipicolinate reductase, partial [Flavobacteriaceae bacterium]|nr:4-hydroxy-tetrahydrodipicolinate reductase [Flavobacteriaceae bacterium]